MKRFAAVAIVFAAAVLPMCAQRGGSHGGFSGHASAPSFHGGFGSSAPSHFGSAPSHFTAPSHFGAAGRLNSNGSFRASSAYQRGRFGNAGTRAPYYPSSRYRRPYRSNYAIGVPYAFPGGVVSWINPDFLGYPDYYDDFSAATDTSAQSYDAPQAEEDQPEGRPAYQQSYEPSYAAPQPAPNAEGAVTIVFKNGRPSEQIHNYALTRTTLYVLDQRHQDIPIEDLDLAATEQANRDAGIDFQLPVIVQ